MEAGRTLISGAAEIGSALVAQSAAATTATTATAATATAAEGEDTIAATEEDAQMLENDFDPVLAGGGVRPLDQSRYSITPLFIAQPCCQADLHSLERLNDVPVVVDEDAYQILRKQQQVDPPLARHIAHLFVRDPLVIFDDAIFLDDNAAMVSKCIVLYCTCQMSCL